MKGVMDVNIKRVIVSCLALVVFLPGWALVILTISRCFDDGIEMSLSLCFTIAFMATAQGAFHQIASRKRVAESKVLFGKLKISMRLYATLMVLLILLACCVIVKLIVGVGMNALAMPIVIVVLYFIGEAIVYHGLRMIERRFNRSRG